MSQENENIKSEEVVDNNTVDSSASGIETTRSDLEQKTSQTIEQTEKDKNGGAEKFVGSNAADSSASGIETTRSDWERKTDRKIEQIEKEMDKLNRDKISLITISGIFVAIFTFISVEIQILRYICDFQKILGFTLILPGILLIFILLLDYVARSWLRSEDLQKPPLITVLLASTMLIAIGLLVMWNSGAQWTCKEDNSEPINIQLDSTKEIDGTMDINLPTQFEIQLTE